MWCNPPALHTALSTDHGQKNIRRSLNYFERMNSPALPQALAKLPANFQRSSKYCSAPQCVFSHTNPGQPARTSQGASHCTFCARNLAGLLAIETAEGGRSVVQRALEIFARKDTGVLRKAWDRLSADFKEGQDSFEAWLKQEKAKQEGKRFEAKVMLDAQRNMLAEDPLLMRERQAMWEEDFVRIAQEAEQRDPLRHQSKKHAGDIVGAQGPTWVLQQPQWRCPHEDAAAHHSKEHCPLQHGYMCTQHAWQCDMNSTNKPPIPVCRVCTEGYRPTDNRPSGRLYFSKLLDLGADKDRLQVYLHDFDRWLAAQPADQRPEQEKWRWHDIPRDLHPQRKASIAKAQKEAEARKRAHNAAKMRRTEANKKTKNKQNSSSKSSASQLFEDESSSSVSPPTLRKLKASPLKDDKRSAKKVKKDKTKAKDCEDVTSYA